MQSLLNIQNKFKQYKNLRVALEYASAEILEFLKVHRMILFRKEVEETSSKATLKFFFCGEDLGHLHSYQKNDFPNILQISDYIDTYTESLVSNSPISFNPSKLDPLKNSNLYNFFKDSDVKSSFIIPIVLHNDIWGTLAFHDLEVEKDLGHEISIKANLIANIVTFAVMASEIESDKARAKLDDHSFRMASLGKLAASIAHEINNPIFLIGGLASKIEKLLLDKKTDDVNDIIQYLRLIQKNCNKTTEIIEGLRLTTRTNKQEQFEVCDTNFLVESLVNLSKDKFNDNKIFIEVDVSKEEALIECKPGQMMQVFTNLINNSLDSLAEVDSKIKKVMIKTLVANEKVIVEFSDSGARPSREIIKNMMEPFFTTKPVGQGSGLGLSISKEIVRKFGGTIFVDEDCTFMKFIIELPRVVFEEDEHL